jgi:CRISPR-associated protein Cas5d
LGTREFAADFALIAEGAPLPETKIPADQRDRDLGWMLHDIDHSGDKSSRFFRA